MDKRFIVVSGSEYGMDPPHKAPLVDESTANDQFNKAEDEGCFAAIMEIQLVDDEPAYLTTIRHSDI